MEQQIEKLSDVIQQLVRAGMSEQEIADEVKSSQASINRIRRGTQRASDDLGQRLRLLRSERCNGKAKP
jgi:hypothetical protein